MANFENGVANYITGKATVTVNFPVDYKGAADISCKQCPYYSKSSGMCQLNKHIPAYPQKYVGQECPLFKDEEE